MILRKGTVVRLKTRNKLRAEGMIEEHGGFYNHKNEKKEIFLPYKLVDIGVFKLDKTVNSSGFYYDGWFIQDWMIELCPMELEIE